MKKVREIVGRIVFSSKDTIFLSVNGEILFSRNMGGSWHKWDQVKNGFIGWCLEKFPLVSRLFRKGVHHYFYTTKESAVVVDKDICIVGQDRSRTCSRLVGSRPMVICYSNETFYYGEYRSNPERSPVHIWKWNPTSHNWQTAWTFSEVRHVHGVFEDPFTGHIWVTTGDADQESAIWKTRNDFQNVERVSGGSQQLRTVQLLFTEEFVYFGSDAPGEVNYIYRMRRDGSELQQLCRVGGSVFYGCKVGHSLFFSTAVEPSEVNRSGCAEVWSSHDGSTWFKLVEFKKDMYSMKYFQYGQVLFPAGEGDGKHLFLTPFATEHHGKTFVYKVCE